MTGQKLDQAEMEAAIESLTAQVAQLTAATTDHAATLAALTSERDAAKSALAEVDAKLSAANATLIERDNSIAELTTEVSALKAANADLTEKQASFDKAVGVAVAKLGIRQEAPAATAAQTDPAKALAEVMERFHAEADPSKRAKIYAAEVKPLLGIK